MVFEWRRKRRKGTKQFDAVFLCFYPQTPKTLITNQNAVLIILVSRLNMTHKSIVSDCGSFCFLCVLLFQFVDRVYTISFIFFCIQQVRVHKSCPLYLLIESPGLFLSAVRQLNLYRYSFCTLPRIVRQQMTSPEKI